VLLAQLLFELTRKLRKKHGILATLRAPLGAVKEMMGREGRTMRTLIGKGIT